MYYQAIVFSHIAEERRRLKLLRLKKKERKLRRKARLDLECIHEKMNCFR